MSLKNYITIILTFFFTFSVVHAHGDLDDRIKKITSEITLHPDSSALFVARGELYYQHEEYENSLIDYSIADSLGYSNTRLDLNMIKSFYQLKRLNDAIISADKILESNAKHVLALRWKASTLQEMKNYKEAAEYFEKVISHSSKAFPVNYLEASFAWLNSEDDNASFKAVQVIENGINSIGPLLVFYNQILSIHEKNSDFKAAIENQTKIIALSNRKEHALVKRAELWVKNQNIDAALIDLESAKIAINQLPRSKKNNSAIINLLNKIELAEIALNP